MTDHYCTTCNRQVLQPWAFCCVCAGKGEMPEPDTCRDIPIYGVCKCWRIPNNDGPTSIERYAQAKAAEAERLREALEHIKKHQETVCPTGYNLSSTWVIANNALAGKEAPQ